MVKPRAAGGFYRRFPQVTQLQWTENTPGSSRCWRTNGPTASGGGSIAETGPHTLAAFAFARLQRDPTFRHRFPGLRNVYVCVESDLLEDVRRQATEHFPDGGELACYFPREHRLVFGVRHAGRGLFTGAREELPATAGQTIGMIVDVLTKDPDWTDTFLTVSTHDVEKQSLLG